MLDGLRENDWTAPRNLRRELRLSRRPSVSWSMLRSAPSGRNWPRRSALTLADCKALQDARPSTGLYRGFSGEGDEDFLERHFTDNDADPASILEEQGRQAAAGLGHWPPSRARENDDGALLRTGPPTCARSARSWGWGKSRVCQLPGRAIAHLRAQIVGEVPKAAKRLKEKARG